MKRKKYELTVTYASGRTEKFRNLNDAEVRTHEKMLAGLSTILSVNKTEYRGK